MFDKIVGKISLMQMAKDWINNDPSGDAGRDFILQVEDIFN